MQTDPAIPLYRLYGQKEAKSLALCFNVQRIETFIDKTGIYRRLDLSPKVSILGVKGELVEELPSPIIVLLK
jgi:hypothetical protein